MKNIGKAAIVFALVALVAGMIIYKNNRAVPTTASAPPIAVVPAADAKPVTEANPTTAEPKALPRLIDLGSVNCIPCKMMAPILKELETEYAGHLNVEFIDVWADPAAGRKYSINLIPTQIFFDASGKELARHEGYISKPDILAKWGELGVKLPAPSATAPANP